MYEMIRKTSYKVVKLADDGGGGRIISLCHLAVKKAFFFYSYHFAL
jgi:hypothetical protein